jgi:hypothetical protein
MVWALAALRIRFGELERRRYACIGVGEIGPSLAGFYKFVLQVRAPLEFSCAVGNLEMTAKQNVGGNDRHNKVKRKLTGRFRISNRIITLRIMNVGYSSITYTRPGPIVSFPLSDPHRSPQRLVASEMLAQMHSFPLF